MLVVAVLMTGLAAACGSGAPDRPVSEQSDATKVTCPDPELTVLPAGLEPVERELVGYGPQVLGVVETYAADDLEVLVVSGGYLDDIAEPYDELAPRRLTTIRGVEAEVLTGTLLDRPVQFVAWREPAHTAPCGTHALIATGVSPPVFDRILSGIR